MWKATLRTLHNMTQILGEPKRKWTSPSLLSNKKGNSFEKGKIRVCPLFELVKQSLSRLYFSNSSEKRAHYLTLRDRKVAQFCYDCRPSGLRCYVPASLLFSRHRPSADIFFLWSFCPIFFFYDRTWIKYC